MSPSPAHLRAVADALNAIADGLGADIADLLPLGGPTTWLGPAADLHRAGALRQESRVEQAVAELRRVHNQLLNAAATAEAHMREVADARERRYRRGIDR